MLRRPLEAFLRAAELGSFSAAARALGLTPAAVSKSIRELEAALGTRLFHRTTHALSLTDDGQELRREVEPALARLDQALERLRDRREAPRGRLRLNLPGAFGRRVILPLVPEFLARYPDVTLDVDLHDQQRDPVAEGYDVSVGNRIDPDSRLVARRLCRFQPMAIASPAYLDRHGRPHSLADLGNHNCLAYRQLASGRTVTWRFQVDGAEHVHVPQGTMTLSSYEAVRDMALAGQGIAVLGCWLVHDLLAEGRLVPILEPYWRAPVPMWIYYAARAHLPAKVRVFIDFMIGRFAATPPAGIEPGRQRDGWAQ